MSIETTLYATLAADSGVTTLTSTRIYPGYAPDSVAKPYIVYQVINDERLSTITGVGDAKRTRIQIACHGNTYSSSKAVAAAVEAALEGNGYLVFSYDLYNQDTQLHTVFVDWSFMA